jgi:hypothetical protein
MALEKRVRLISLDSSQFFRFCRIPARFRRNHCLWFAGIIVEGILKNKITVEGILEKSA